MHASTGIGHEIGLINQPSALRCDCGYNFQKKQVDPGKSLKEQAEEVRRGIGQGDIIPGSRSKDREPPATDVPHLKSVFRIAFILLWGLMLLRLFPEAEGTLRVAKWVVVVLLAPFWGGVGSHIGEQIEKRYKTRRSSNSAAERVDPRLVGIRGWLILQAIYLIGAPIANTPGLIALLAQSSDAADAGYGGPNTLQILVLLGCLVVNLYAAIRFFLKKKNAPSAMIGFWIASVVTFGLLRVIAVVGWGAEDFKIDTLLGLIFAAAIWIHYFRVSKRVKVTFVN